MLSTRRHPAGTRAIRLTFVIFLLLLHPAGLTSALMDALSAHTAENMYSLSSVHKHWHVPQQLLALSEGRARAGGPSGASLLPLLQGTATLKLVNRLLFPFSEVGGWFLGTAKVTGQLELFPLSINTST